MSPESVVLHSGAIVFNGAMVTLFPAFFCGARYVLHRSFDAEAFIDTVERERVTHTMLVPAQIIAILNARGFDPARLLSLECILSLGAPLHVEHKDRLNQAPAGTLLRALRADRGLRHHPRPRRRAAQVRQRRRAAAVLRPAHRRAETTATCRAGEIGEIVGRGPITMPGYYRPERRRRRRCATGGSTPATWATSTTRASSTSSTG
jgi:long-chain acyl-CoA synthetase